MNTPIAREVMLDGPSKFRYSICTLVSRTEDYREMIDSFIRAGFETSFCEYLFIDNSSETKAEAFRGYNAFLNCAQGEFVIMCHQDILLKFDRIEQLETCVQELDRLAPSWGVLGNAGGVKIGEIAICITDSEGKHDSGGFPAQVQTLDENFILVKRSANLCVSHDLKGFHLYGTDLCLIATILGFTSWVVNFNLFHKSKGNPDENFRRLCHDFTKKYKRINLNAGALQTTCTELYVSGSGWIIKHSIFKRMYQLRKKCATPDQREKLEGDTKKLLGVRYYLHWMVYKLLRPIENFRRSTARRSAAATVKRHRDTA